MRAVSLSLSALLLVAFWSASVAAEPRHLLWQMNETFTFEPNTIRVWEAGLFSSYDAPNSFVLATPGIPTNVSCEDCHFEVILFDSKQDLEVWKKTGIVQDALLKYTLGVFVNWRTQLNITVGVNYFAVALKTFSHPPIPNFRWEANATSNATVPSVCGSEGGSPTSFSLVGFQPSEEASICPTLPLQVNCSQAGKDLEFTGEIDQVLKTFQAELHYNWTMELDTVSGVRCDGLVFRRDNYTTDLNIHCQADSPAHPSCFYFYQHHNGTAPHENESSGGWTKEKTYLVIIGVLALVAAVALVSSVVLLILRLRHQPHRYHAF
ncbi:hypothetical protein QOT17_013418 [Balamuthia mandrillaris]